MDTEKTYIISYLTLRKIVGILGIALPIVLIIGSLLFCEDKMLEQSISKYYHTCMRDTFVGILCAIALFLFAYKGYDPIDNIISNLAGIFAMLVVFCPTSEGTVIGIIHLISAFLFFISLTYFSLFLFTKGAKPFSDSKKKRNKIYRTCGYIMTGAIVILFIIFVLPLETRYKLHEYKVVLWLESIALWAFGVSWLVKGKFILSDE